MSVIGLDKLYYAVITEDKDGNETYAAPVKLAKAINVELSIELAEGTLYADNSAAEVIKEFKNATLKLGIDDIGIKAAEVLTGAKIDDNKVLISTSDDEAKAVAIAFRAKKSNGKFRYFWLYRVKFGIPENNLTTKGDNIEFATPTIEGTVTRRNKEDSKGNHPWKAEVNEDDEGVPSDIIGNWYREVYEPIYDTPTT
ncbi:MAG: phage tail protein [Oscillospiraceae bacterium]|nr:phage tail protein [Oscillospiraceae bacterium]